MFVQRSQVMTVANYESVRLEWKNRRRLKQTGCRWKVQNVGIEGKIQYDGARTNTQKYDKCARFFFFYLIQVQTKWDGKIEYVVNDVWK